MRKERIDMHRLQDLVRLHRQGCHGRQLGKLLKMSPNTERTYREALKAEITLRGGVARSLHPT